MTYDIGRGKTVLFGGNTAPNVPNGETWELCGLTITTHPSPQTACGGGAAVFAVAASGSVALSYQWRKNCVPLIDQPSHIFGATSSVLSLMNVTIADDGIYDCVVTNACGSFTSRSAALRVAPADFNRDGVVNSQDLFDFLAAFFTGC